MRNVTWTYLGPNGTRSVVDLKHGIQSGNFVLFCNYKVLVIDFDVFEPKSYPFFINHDLCQVDVEKKGESFSYKFQILKDVDTPLNRWRKKVEKREWRLTSALIAATILSVFLAVFFLHGWKYRIDANTMQQSSLITVGKFVVENHEYNGETFNAHLQYNYRNSIFNSHYRLPVNSFGEVISANGLPLQSGDEFYIQFSHRQPNKNRVDYFKPTIAQISKYRNRVSNKYRSENRQVSSSEIDCLMDSVYEVDGLTGWANLYFHNVGPEKNVSNNETSYQKILENQKLKEKISKCKG